MKPGDKVKTKYGVGKVIELNIKPSKYFPFDSWKVELDNPSRNLMGGTCWTGGFEKVVERGMLSLFASEIEVLEYKQGDLF